MNEQAVQKQKSAHVFGLTFLLAVILTAALALPGSPAPAVPANPSLMASPAPSPAPPQAQISVAISPSSYGLTVSQSVALTATVANDSSGRGVTWSVSGSSCSGTGCGTLSSVTSTSVIYTASATGGVYLVTATSVADVTRSATASIGVTDLAGVFTYRNDGTRTGINAKEYLLTSSNVNASSFGKLFSCTVDGSVYAQPLWVANAAIGGGTHNVVIVATQHDSVYAFDADNGSGTTCTQYWKASLLLSTYGAGANATPVPPVDTGETGDIPTEIGITSTPVVDPSTNSLYVVSKTKEGGSYFQRLHKLNLADGTEKAGAPVPLSASVPGTGNGSSGNSLPYIALRQNQRPGLALVNGILYIASGSHGDNQPWHGWILAYNASTLTLAGAYCTTPNSNGGGIWMSGSAPVFDSGNNVYVISSNGIFDGNTEFSDSFLKLSTASGLTISDWFTPNDQANLGANNIDLGQGGAITLLDSVSGPYPHLVIGGGKGGVLYLINRDNMGHYHSSDNNQAIQTWSLGNQIASSGTFWQNTFYIGAANTPLQAFAFNTTTALFNTNPTSQSNVSVGFPGLTPAISASGTSNAIIWTVDSSKSGTNGASTGPAVLYAFDPNNLANELWDSTQGTGNQPGNAVKFVAPTIANGKVYVGSVNTLTVYGLLSHAPAAASPTFSPAPGGYTSPQNVTLSDTTSGATIYYTTDGSIPTTSSPVYSSPINVSTSKTIKAMAAAPGLNNSPVSTGGYTIQGPVTGTISYVQGYSATPQSPTSSVSLSFNGGQTAGDLNVVVVGWSDSTATVSSVTDSKGNVYTQAVGPTTVTGALSQSIYYAKNIASAAPGANIVTVAFSAPAAYPDIRILEYSGADLVTPVDVTSASTGNSTSSASVAATTTSANDLLFGANTVQTATTGPGAGFTSRMITFPDGDIAEDRLVAATGSYSATATINPAGLWIMQMVAFRASGGVTTPPTAPTNLTATVVSSSQINLSWTASTGGAGVTGYLLERCVDPTNRVDCSNFSQIAAPTGTTYNDTGLLSSARYLYRVRATDAAGNLSGYSNIAIATTPAATPPTVSSVSPNNGPTAGGTAVTITGTNFVAGATVTFGSAAATNVVVVNSTTITATTPVGSAGAVTVTVTVGGQSGSLANGFTYVVAPTVSSVSPNSGPVAGGTSVTITGTNFAAGATVKFGSTAATNVAVVNSTTITATTPAAGSAGAVTVTVTVNGQSGSLANGFTYVGVPTVSSVSPNSGPTAGGTSVTITGTNFATGATVTFGSAAATNVVVNSTTITATTPAGSAGAVTVTVTNVGSQSGSLANGYTYVVAPTVSSVSPNSGPVTGGTSVTITGTNFAAGATVKFGSTAATNVAVVNSTTITATTPAAGSAGAVTVTMTVNGQSGSLANGFTYTGTVAISFGQVAAATPQSPTASVVVSYPAAQTAGDLNVVVVGWNDTTATVQSVKDSAGNNYTLAIGPTTGTGLQQSIYYAANIVGGSNTVTVTFSQAAAYPDIRILEYRGVTALAATAGASGNSAAASSGTATTTSANELIFGANTVATGNAAAGSGFTARIITSPDGDLAEDKIVTVAGSNSATATLTGSGPWVMQMATFAAVSGPLPTVSSVSPNSGSTAGGTSVTITGTNFAAGAAVTFGSGSTTNVAVVNGTTITATTPAGSAGAVTVTVTNPGGQSGSLASAFTYIASPTVSSVSPNSGSTAGGTSVTITGTNFAAGATVTFGSNAATNVAVVNSTTLTATTPALQDQ